MRYTHLLRTVPRIVRNAVASDYERLDREIYDLFTTMGGVYTKFLQILVSNVNVLKSLGDSERMKVFADTKPSPIDHIAVLRKQLGSRFDRIAHIDSEPFSTGSFANVYRATLLSGEHVVIKIKRPDLDKQLRNDLQIIRIVSRIIDAFDSQNRYGASSIAKEYTDGIRREIDYPSEVRNATMMSDEYVGVDSITVPKTYSALCTKDVIVQERIDGLLLSDVMKKSQAVARKYTYDVTGSDLTIQLQKLSENFLDRSFKSQPIHGDPHPGNILLLPNNKVALIDFGLIAESAEDISGYLEYMYEQTFINYGEIRPGKFGVSLLRTHSSGLYRALATVDRNLPNAEILNSIETMMDERFMNNAENTEGIVYQMQGGQTNQIYDAVVNPGNNLALSFDMDGMLMLRANNIIWTTMSQLGIYRDIAPYAVHNSVQRARNSMVLVRNKNSTQDDLESALEVVSNWVYSIRESDPVFFRSLMQVLPVQLN